MYYIVYEASLTNHSFTTSLNLESDVKFVRYKDKCLKGFFLILASSPFCPNAGQEDSA